MHKFKLEINQKKRLQKTSIFDEIHKHKKEKNENERARSTSMSITTNSRF